MEDIEVSYDLIEKHSFCIVFSINKGQSVATHLPLILDRNTGYLYGHFARLNTQWEEIKDQEILIVFHGPHHYISSSWYETNMSVPTWNYTAVHVYGAIELMSDAEELLETLNNMLKKYEDSNSSYRLDGTNQELIEGLMKGIVGFKLKINRIEGKSKLSQNHSRERQELVIDKLMQIRNDNAQEIAQLMKENIREM